MTDETEVNPLRAMMTHNIITQHPDAPLSVDALKEFFPPDFYLGPDDLAPHIRAAATTLSEMFEGDELPTPKPAEPTPAPAEVKAEAEPEPEALPPTAEEIEAAVTRRRVAEQNLANLRVDVLKATGVERAARDALAKAVTTFQSGTAFAPLSPEQLRRQHVQEQAAIRQGQKDGTIPISPRAAIGRSAIDRQAFYSRGGNPAHGNYRRGSYPSQAQGAKNYDSRRGPVAKVPEKA